VKIKQNYDSNNDFKNLNHIEDNLEEQVSEIYKNQPESSNSDLMSEDNQMEMREDVIGYKIGSGSSY
jgi:hypothetical protein